MRLFKIKMKSKKKMKNFLDRIKRHYKIWSQYTHSFLFQILCSIRFHMYVSIFYDFMCTCKNLNKARKNKSFSLNILLCRKIREFFELSSRIHKKPFNRKKRKNKKSYKNRHQNEKKRKKNKKKIPNKCCRKFIYS